MNILVVDDEPSILQLLGSYLRRNGHTVLTAATGAEAFATLGSAFEVAVVDLTLPDMSGVEVATAVLSRTSARVILASGYAVEPDVLPAVYRSRVRILRKPFMPKAMLELL